jgi:hypothetical protein
MLNPDVDGLKIGDLITLKSPKWNAWLGSEGILLDDLIVTEMQRELGDCIFSVHLQRQYSASRELESFLDTYHVSESGTLDEGKKQYLKALQKGRDNEIRLNDVYMNNKLGQVVNFGDIVQLFHVKSKKYVVINPKILASAERENSRVGLSQSGNVYSWVRFMPRFKIDRPGDRILSNSELYINLAERQNEYVHAAEKFLRGDRREVNCSMEQTSWKMLVYQGAEHIAQQSEIVLASQLVYLHDAETRSNVTIASPAIKTLDSPDPRVEELEGGGGDREEKSVGGDDQDNQEFIHEFGNIVLQPMQGDIVDNRSVWVMETIVGVKGGPIHWKSEHARFKNIHTGHYLRYKKVRAYRENGESFDKTVFFSCESPGVGTQFHFFEPNSTRKTLSKAKALQVGAANQWLSRGEHCGLSFQLKSSLDKAEAVNLLINEFVPYKGANEGHRLDREPDDIFSALSLRSYLKKYVDMTEIPQNRVVSTLWPTAERSDVQFYQNVMVKGKNFAQGFLISDEHITLGVDKSDQLLRVQRQHIARELGVLEWAMRMVNKLKPITDMYDKSIAKKTPLIDSEQAVLRFSNMLLGQALDLVYYCILDCAENQMYVADFLPDLLAHLSSQPLAGKCVTAMLSTNMELQETKIGGREISIFVDKLRSSKMNSMYLNLLQSCCSCQGQGVDNNQCRVADMLFEDTNDIIISLVVDFVKCQRVDWGASIYIPESSVLGSPMEGQLLYDKGLPELALAWTTNAIDFSPLGLFGKLSVNVQDLYKPISNDGPGKELELSPEKAAALKKSKAKTEKSTNQKNAVAEYFINQLYLGAEMCMDRNYVAMHKLDPLFSFEALVSIMKLNVKNTLKAAACRLLFCLHVDRDPQVATKIPCLTRTWSDITKHAVPELPFVEPARRNVFALIQQMVSEHVVGMRNRRWDLLSKRILEMLFGLLKFNFYGSIDRMQDVIGPVINALDRRGVDYGSQISTSFVGDESVKKGQDGGEVKTDVELTDEITWQKRHFEFLESLPVMCGILALVLIAVTLTIIQVATNSEETEEIAIFGLAVLAVFLYDFCMRFYCYVHTYGSPGTFLCSAFNIIDQVVIGIDIAFLFLPSDIGGNNAQFTKTLRLIRLVRLVRVLRAVKVINAFTKKKVEVIKWVAPLRYSKIPMFELETMTEAINVLLFVQGVIEDRNLSLLMQKFYSWQDGTCSGKTPGQLIEDCIAESQELTLGINDFDGIFIDAIMFKHLPLVQGSLNTLMARHSMLENLLRNAKSVQLLVSPKRERQFRLVSATVQQLERNAETHELWGELASDLDRATNKQTKDILNELIDLCRIRSPVLDFGTDFQPDREIQDLLRNLGLFGIALKVLGLLDSVEEDESGELDEVAQNTRELCLLCNTLVYWFTLNNSANQEIVYGELDFFLQSLDDHVKSHKVIRAIFKGNETLMKLVPHAHLSQMADKICQDGKSHHYLSLAAAITHVGEKNITKNQFEIIKTLCGPQRLDKVACWLVGPSHPDYQEKLEVMKKCNSFEDDLDDMPPLMAYHIAFLEVLSNCTVGRINVTSIEAKVQSVFSTNDVLASIMHPDTALVVKKFLTLHLFNAIIEVEIMIPGLEKSAVLWNLLLSYKDQLKNITKDIEELDRSNWASPKVSRLQIEYYIACIMVIGGFFARYYDPHAMANSADGSGEEQATVNTNLDQNAANDLMKSLFDILIPFYKYNSPRLDVHTKNVVFECIESLNKSAKNPFYAELKKLHLSVENVQFDEDDTGHFADEAREKEVLGKYIEFLQLLDSDEEVQNKVRDEIKGFISVISEMPFLKDSSDAEVRFEPFIQKLVSHVRENMTLINEERRIGADCTATTTWIIKCWRTMIEEAMGMSIYERDEDGGAEEDEKAGPIVTALSENGVTGLCLELIAVGVDEALQTEVVKLLVAMLFKEGGAREVQECVNTYLMKNNSELFFKQVRATLQKLMAWHKWNEIIILEEGEEPSPPGDILIVRMLQLLSEGHYLPNQNIMREQPNNAVQYNLLDDFVNYYNVLSRLPCRTSTDAAIRVGATIVEVIQGPCVGNQRHLALNTEILEIQNRIMRSKPVNDCEIDAEIELKKTCLDTISALLEGQMPTDQVTERILSVIHLDIIMVLSKPPEFVEKNARELTEDEIGLQTDCSVLLQMLCDYKPSIREELEADGGLEMNSEATACVEISWDGVLNRRFFSVPEVCSLLAKSSKDKLVLEVDRSNPENKLIDFLTRSQDLYREVKHQEYLGQLGIAAVFSRTNQDRATWFTFVLSVVINALLVAYYKAEDGREAMPDQAVQIVSVLNYIQMSVSFFTMILTFVVRSPVIAQSLREDSEAGYNTFQIILYTALDPMTVYYVGYLIISMLGQFVAHYYLALLLLDIVVKDVTTADVLNAVIQPRKQLMYALLLGVFVIYIFSFYTFFYFRHQVISGDLQPFCTNLFDCTKFCISYGLQNGGGISDNMLHAKGWRLVLDLAWFIVVLVVFINIIFGIVIDTFSSLRAEKNERAANTTAFCFICSIPRQIFDRNSDVPDGFKNHIKHDHNMWSYLYFIFFLWEQDKDDDDGLEYYVRHKVSSNEITWFPMNKAMCLDHSMTDAEALTKDLQESVGKANFQMAGKIERFQVDIKNLLFSLTDTLQDDNFIRGDDYLDPTATQGGDKPENIEWDPAWGYDLGVLVTEIAGIEPAVTEDLKQLTFRLISDAGMYSNEATSVNLETKSALFEQFASYSVGEGIQQTDPRTFQLQVLVKPSGAGMVKFVSVVEVKLSELMAVESGAVVEKKLICSAQPVAATVVLKSVYSKSIRSSSSVAGDDDLDVDDD